MQKQSIIILGHGSKSIHAIEDFNFIVEATKEKSENENVYGAHMELAKPSLEEVVAEISEKGISTIAILPYFLFNGNHIKMDIPKKILAIKKKYPKLNICFGTPIGKEPMMVDLMIKKAKELV